MKRSDQRRQAVFALYQHDLTGRELDDVFESDTTEFARTLATSTLADRERIDERLAGFIKQGWTLERVAPLERNILRVAVHELGDDEVPSEVAVDEAVELAKRYCSADAPKFVNGILGAMLRDDQAVESAPEDEQS